MKIRKTSDELATEALRQERRPAETALRNAKAKAKEEKTDSVSLGAGLAISAEIDAARVAEEDRAAKVERLKKAVQSGSYQIPASQVLAEKFVEGMDEEVDILKFLEGTSEA